MIVVDVVPLRWEVAGYLSYLSGGITKKLSVVQKSETCIHHIFVSSVSQADDLQCNAVVKGNRVKSPDESE